MISPGSACLRAKIEHALGRLVAAAFAIVLLASPLRADAQAGRPPFSRVSATAYGTVLDSCGVTQTAVTISTFGTTDLENAPNAAASVVVYRFDRCKRSPVFAYGASRRCDLSVGAADGSRWPKSVTVSGQIPLSVFTSSGHSRDTARFELTLQWVNAPSGSSDENHSGAAGDDLYDHSVDTIGEMTLPALGLRSFPLPNGQMKFER
ncbi:hypothetical protein [Burkholderia ubonensis]|uniref:hypothetical protein n=1 Tax=Burkholderia ubonensis TaxID=101571 RepID=UPI001056769C|nr:hypothetical protein [Burkholderia ubonensis]